MEKYKRFYGAALFLAVAFFSIYLSYNAISPKIEELNVVNSTLEQKQGELNTKRNEKVIVESKIKKIKDSVAGSQKKIYAPSDSDLGNDTLFFTLYNDMIEMVHANSVKIKSINYTYNPKDDEFVKFGKDVYFVCDVNLELVSNYTNLGKLIQDIYQYPYYIKISSLEVKPYAKDKKILITNLNLRLYARTEPQEATEGASPKVNTSGLPGI